VKKIFILLSALFIINCSFAQSYTVTSIPYNPPAAYDTGTAVLVNIDDTWSSAITLPFTFNFFGIPYTQLIIGSNEIISFDITSNAGNNCPWNLTSGIPIPTSTFPLNSIMGPYQDIDPTLTGHIYWQVTGASPNRMFVVSFDSIPYYGDINSDYYYLMGTTVCPNPLYATCQIVLYETTNIIDIYIQSKDDCPGWNNGLAIEGIQDSTGVNAAIVTGRNNSVWTATNDAWRFAPATVKISEFDANNSISIMPNPGNGIFTISLQQYPTKVLGIEIFNSLGQIINKDVLNTKTKIIDISNSPKGIYFLKVSSEGKYLFKKIIIE
jgi:hypothetical protein